MEVSRIQKVVSTLHDLQLRIDDLMKCLERTITQRPTESEKIETIRSELAGLFAEQISTQQSVKLTGEYQNSDEITKQKISQYPNFQQWLRSVDIRHALSVSLESNFDSLESICVTSSEDIRSIASKLYATDSEIETLFSGLRLLKRRLEESRKKSSLPENTNKQTADESREGGSGTVVRRCSSLESTGSVAVPPRPFFLKQQHLTERPGDASDDGYGTQTSVDRSPGPFSLVVGRMSHDIRHSFVPKKFYLTNIGSCGVCHKFLVSGMKCSNCKFKCHKKCEHKVLPHCGLDPLLREQLNTSNPKVDSLTSNSSNSLPRTEQSKILGREHIGNKSAPGIAGSSTWHSKSTPWINRDLSQVSFGTATKHHNGLESNRVKGSFSSESSNSRIHAMGNLNDSSAGSCSSSFAALSGSELTHGNVGAAHPGKRRVSSSTTGASSDVSSSVESSPSHLKPNTPAGSHLQQIFNFSPSVFTDREYRKMDLTPADSLQVPMSAPYHHTVQDITSPPSARFVPRNAEDLSANQHKRLYRPAHESESRSVVFNRLENQQIVSSDAGSRYTIAGDFAFTPQQPSVGQEDSEGVTISRGSENTSTTLTDSENTANGTATASFRDRWSIGESFDKRIDDDYDEIMSLQDVKLDKLLGTGRFATVYRGYWHGEVAVKVYHLSNEVCVQSKSRTTQPVLARQQQVSQGSVSGTGHFCSQRDMAGVTFQSLVGSRRASTTLQDTDIIMKDIKTLCKARHNNIVLFMAACKDPQTPAIITSLCKGKTLYRKIHLAKEEMPMLTVISILEQVAQGMGYLHGRAIVHKDLRTNNLFVDERGHVTITDYGLANITKVIQHPNSGELVIHCPFGWLSYLAPELISRLRTHRNIDQMLPFTMETDVYAFGAVCFEMLSGHFLHENLISQCIIWSVGSGCKISLAAFQSSKSVKDFLLSCWNFNPDRRPLFSQIHSYLRELDRKTRSEKSSLSRCPSQPIAVSRSMERMNAAF